MKKNSFAVFALALLAACAIMPIQAKAANELLVIDTAHIYAGMDKTYGQGYAPQINAEDVTLRMPLIVSQIYQGSVQGDAIMVTPDLGDPRTSPFIAGDYSESVTLRNYGVQDEQGNQVAQKAYYIVLHLPLQAARVNGKYPVVLHISYLDNQGLSISQSFSADVVVTDGTQPTQNGGKQTASSQIALTNYDVNPSVVEAGQGFAVDFTLQNTGKQGAATDILVSYNAESDDITLKGSTGTLFISTIEKGAQQICHIEMDTQPTAKTGINRIFVKTGYTDEGGSPASATFEIPVMIRQPIRLEYGAPSIPGEAPVGSDIAASLLITNSGMDTLYDVAVSLQSDGFISKADTFLGNMESGSHKTASIIAKPVGQPRTVYGKFVVSYEDENGEQYSDEVPFDSRILPAATAYWRLPADLAVIVAVVVAAAAGIAVYLLYKNRKKEGRQE